MQLPVQRKTCNNESCQEGTSYSYARESIECWICHGTGFTLFVEIPDQEAPINRNADSCKGVCHTRGMKAVACGCSCAPSYH